ncbi:MAG: hypothetical protein ACREDR_15315, partial [Blastocatellia bacterium]
AGVAVPTTHFFDHKAFRIELPRRGDCQVDFLGEEAAVFRFEYDGKLKVGGISATKKHRKAQKERKVREGKVGSREVEGWNVEG